MDTNTLYDELELPRNCTVDEIKQKYRVLAQKYHPDKGGDESKFIKIKQAYETLSDPIKRSHYDNTGDYYTDTNISNEVNNRLSNMIDYHTQQMNPEIEDLILRMKLDIYDAQKQTNNAINSCNQTVRKLNIISNKIKLKQIEGENFLKSIVESKINSTETILISHKRTLLVFDKMLEILEKYHYSLQEYQLFIQSE